MALWCSGGQMNSDESVLGCKGEELSRWHFFVISVLPLYHPKFLCVWRDQIDLGPQSFSSSFWVQVKQRHWWCTLHFNELDFYLVLRLQSLLHALFQLTSRHCIQPHILADSLQSLHIDPSLICWLMDSLMVQSQHLARQVYRSQHHYICWWWNPCILASVMTTLVYVPCSKGVHWSVWSLPLRRWHIEDQRNGSGFQESGRMAQFL